MELASNGIQMISRHWSLFFINLLLRAGLALLIEPPPSFQSPEKAIIVVSIGDRANLKCRVDNLGDKTVTWKRLRDVHPLTIGLQPFLIDPRIRVDHNQRLNEWNLVITEVDEDDEGIYQCQISTKNDFESHNITLKLRRVQLSGTNSLDQGQPIRLECKATNYRGQPSPVTWFKDDVMLKTGNHVMIADDLRENALFSRLQVRRSTWDDSGLYRCATSRLDSDSMFVRVRHVTPTKSPSNSFPEVLRMSSGASKLLTMVRLKFRRPLQMELPVPTFVSLQLLLLSSSSLFLLLCFLYHREVDVLANACI